MTMKIIANRHRKWIHFEWITYKYQCHKKMEFKHWKPLPLERQCKYNSTDISKYNRKWKKATTKMVIIFHHKNCRSMQMDRNKQASRRNMFTNKLNTTRRVKKWNEPNKKRKWMKERKKNILTYYFVSLRLRLLPTIQLWILFAFLSFGFCFYVLLSTKNNNSFEFVFNYLLWFLFR